MLVNTRALFPGRAFSNPFARVTCKRLRRTTIKSPYRPNGGCGFYVLPGRFYSPSKVLNMRTRRTVGGNSRSLAAGAAGWADPGPERDDFQEDDFDTITDDR